jgi:hypothetical protein
MVTYSIYYMKAEFFRDGMRGFDWLRARNLLPNPADLSASHVFLLRTEAGNLTELYYKMQGEDWAPDGDARAFIASKGLRHTSMTVGDVAVDHSSGIAYLVDPFGFRRLTNP